MSISLLTPGAVACDDARIIREQKVQVGCGLCRYKMEGKRCFWAVELGGTHYPVQGATPPHHNSHAPDGMCVVDRSAVVAGKLEDGQFMATKFELIPMPASENSKPTGDHEHDRHHHH